MKHLFSLMFVLSLGVVAVSAQPLAAPTVLLQAAPSLPPSSEPSSQEAPKKNCELTMEEFMKTKIRATMKDKTLSAEERDSRMAKHMKALQALVPDPTWNEGKKPWNKIVQNVLDSKQWKKSCFSCHFTYGRKYHKGYKDTKICLDETHP